MHPLKKTTVQAHVMVDCAVMLPPSKLFRWHQVRVPNNYADIVLAK